MCCWTQMTDGDLAEDYGRWLAGGRPRDALAADAERIFREAGPAMCERFQLDLAEFLRERSAAELARFVALNDDPRDDRGYLASLDARTRRRIGR